MVICQRVDTVRFFSSRHRVEEHNRSQPVPTLSEQAAEEVEKLSKIWTLPLMGPTRPSSETVLKIPGKATSTPFGQTSIGKVRRFEFGHTRYSAARASPCFQATSARPKASNNGFETGSVAALYSGCHCTAKANPGASLMVMASAVPSGA